MDRTKSSHPEETDTVEIFASISALVAILISSCSPAIVSAAQNTLYSSQQSCREVLEGATFAVLYKKEQGFDGSNSIRRPLWSFIKPFSEVINQI